MNGDQLYENIQAYEHGYAVVVGVGGDLPVTVKDAEGVYGLLVDPERCAYPPDQVVLLTGEKAGRNGIINALEDLAEKAQADPEATIVVFFSGHGVEVPGYYLIPDGFDLNDLDQTAISGELFTEMLRNIGAKKLLVFLDCCHAGGQAEAKGMPGSKSPVPKSLVSDFGKSSGRVLIASSRKNELSWTGQPYSVFTGALLEALAGYGASENDGYSRVLDAALWIGRQVPNRTGDKQHPILKVSNLEDNFAVAFYAAGKKRAKKLDWTAPVPAVSPGLDEQFIASRKKMMANYRDSLMILEERMSEFIDFTDIPLQWTKNKRAFEARIADLEEKLGLKQQ